MREAAAGGMVPYYTSPSGDVTLYQGDAIAVLRALPAGSVHTCCTSPPYWNLRDYQTGGWEGGDPECAHKARDKSRGVTSDARLGYVRESETYRAVCGKCGARRVDAQIGLEESPEAYVAALVAVFREVKRVLHPTGTCWINLGDGYGNERSWGGKSGAKNAGSDAGGYPRHKVGPGLGNKQLLMMPSRVAIALQEDGWLLRSMIPYLKRSAMPESVSDRPTTATEYVFLLAKSERYFYDSTAVQVGSSENTHSRGSKKSPPKSLIHGDPSAHVRNNRSFMEATWGPVSARNRRNADWWFDSLRAILAGATGLLADEDGAPLALPVNPAAYPGAHFATFAPKLVEPMVLASTSAAGCCPRCLAPYTRVVERTGAPAASHKGSYFDRGKTGVNGNGRVQSGERCERVATGWRAGCGCAEAGDAIPAVVLDPFAGACTTGLVARKHGRHFIGIDLSAAYLDLARERLGQLALPPMAGG
jgi:DNA modification methylase